MGTDRSRRSARRAALRRDPVRFLRSQLRRRRGISLEHPVPADRHEILARLVRLPVSVWTYGFDDDSVRHLGPMAQDFAAAFGLGDDDRVIDMVDANGVVMAAVQALHQRVVALEHELAELRQVHERCDDNPRARSSS